MDVRSALKVTVPTDEEFFVVHLDVEAAAGCTTVVALVVKVLELHGGLEGEMRLGEGESEQTPKRGLHPVPQCFVSLPHRPSLLAIF